MADLVRNHAIHPLAVALARWAMDDEELTYADIEAWTLGAEEDVERILSFIPPADSYVVEARPEFDTEGGQGFAVNGVGFALQYEQEGPGRVQPAATWRPPCEDCDEPVEDFGDSHCPTCVETLLTE